MQHRRSVQPHRERCPHFKVRLSIEMTAIKYFYCGRTDHITRYCMKKKFDDGWKRHKKHVGHFADEEQSQNLRLFIFDFAL